MLSTSSGLKKILNYPYHPRLLLSPSLPRHLCTPLSSPHPSLGPHLLLSHPGTALHPSLSLWPRSPSHSRRMGGGRWSRREEWKAMPRRKDEREEGLPRRKGKKTGAEGKGGDGAGGVPGPESGKEIGPEGGVGGGAKKEKEEEGEAIGEERGGDVETRAGREGCQEGGETMLEGVPELKSGERPRPKERVGEGAKEGGGEGRGAVGNERKGDRGWKGWCQEWGRRERVQ